jgi:formylglycine-generating enzyme required for sulfatase activity
LTASQKRRWLAAGIGATVVLGLFLVWRHLHPAPPGAGLRRATNSLGMEFIQLPAGKFLMGSPDSEPGRDDDEEEHDVEITRPFFLGIHEVTQEQFERVMGFNPSVFKEGTEHGGPNHPVENVSWDEAAAFCQKLGQLPEEQKAGRRYRLPTEAEWEYACRAGKNGKQFSTGDSLAPTQANILDPKHSSAGPTTPVGMYAANNWGLFDMHGNVWEWCSDWYDADYYASSPAKDPTGPSSGDRHVARGGSRANPSRDCRCANRVALATGVRLGMGLRVVLVEGAD